MHTNSTYRLMKKQRVEFQKWIAQVINKLNKQIIKKTDILKMDSGKIRYIKSNIALAIKTKLELEEVILELGWESGINKYLDNNQLLLKDRIKTLKVKIPDRNKLINKGIIGEIQKAYYQNLAGVKDVLIADIGSALVDSVIGGAQYYELLENVDKKLQKFAFEAETQIRTMKTTYYQTMENDLAKEIGFGKKDDVWEYIGAPLQHNSHRECIWALTQKPNAPFFTNQEKQDFEAGIVPDHTEPRWNCQHVFAMTSLNPEKAERESEELKARYEEDYKDAIKQMSK